MVHSTGSPTRKEEVFGFHKPNSILQFSGTPATGFLGRLGGPASSPISCCCNEMLSLDCRLEGVPSVPKSCRKWRFSSAIRAFVHSSDLAVFGLDVARHCLLWVFRLHVPAFILHWSGSPGALGWSRRCAGCSGILITPATKQV